jgi:5-oxoprolinase (ATP-hydrolysing)/N-methylhydantoinase A
LFGGRTGWTPWARVLDQGGRETESCGAGRTITVSDPDAVVEMQLAGGSGFGDPRERPLEKIEDDLLNGYVTAEGAARDYGVVLGADGRIDRKATHAARGSR